MRAVFRLLAAIVLLAGAAMPALAADGGDGCDHYITALPIEVSSPGTWCLASDLASDPADKDSIWGVWVRADDVTIDCRGHLMDGTGTQYPGRSAVLSMGGDGQHDRTVVRNCRLRGYTEGVSLEGNGHRVEGLLATDILITGIAIFGNRAVVRGNRIIETGGQGIAVWGSGDVLDNVIRGFVNYKHSDAAEGIVMQSSTSGTVKGNRIVLAQSGVEPPRVGSGIKLNSAADVVVRDNVIISTEPGRSLDCNYYVGSSANHVIDNVGIGVAPVPDNCGSAINNRIYP
ncbi:right-handed parallel beta-helix repeat-containing protein [Luteimonas sp. 8-5]|uniref:right-handed parallel beta-helix repeat-containing protein n=1 Tax=Luteimonas sp. 8-5 TaxID=3039387 RepID=UPI0024366F69|nr:right-handed parallel beta-helix repeat-containing protein [Luteimonas sp. 8-5]MDG6347721.1 right-handed parallel beta-helix repeat-containing protein [Luteimonas sp. 8-5]